MTRWNRRAHHVPFGPHGGARGGWSACNFELTQRAIFSAARPQLGGDAAQHHTSAATTHGQWATAETAPNPATSASSPQVEALLQDTTNMLTVDAASWTGTEDRQNTVITGTCPLVARRCNEVETGGHCMMGWGPASSTLKDMLVRTQHARF